MRELRRVPQRRRTVFTNIMWDDGRATPERQRAIRWCVEHRAEMYSVTDCRGRFSFVTSPDTKCVIGVVWEVIDDGKE